MLPTEGSLVITLYLEGKSLVVPKRNRSGRPCCEWMCLVRKGLGGTPCTHQKKPCCNRMFPPSTLVIAPKGGNSAPRQALWPSNRGTPPSLLCHVGRQLLLLRAIASSAPTSVLLQASSLRYNRRLGPWPFTNIIPQGKKPSDRATWVRTLKALCVGSRGRLVCAPALGFNRRLGGSVSHLESQIVPKMLRSSTSRRQHGRSRDLAPVEGRAPTSRCLLRCSQTG